jgi:hypothetical protein
VGLQWPRYLEHTLLDRSMAGLEWIQIQHTGSESPYNLFSFGTISIEAAHKHTAGLDILFVKSSKAADNVHPPPPFSARAL